MKIIYKNNFNNQSRKIYLKKFKNTFTLATIFITIIFNQFYYFLSHLSHEQINKSPGSII